jgi:NADH:ubiquinone oxidoreductase subunit 6 (subunit J)
MIAAYSGALGFLALFVVLFLGVLFEAPTLGSSSPLARRLALWLLPVACIGSLTAVAALFFPPRRFEPIIVLLCLVVVVVVPAVAIVRAFNGEKLPADTKRKWRSVRAHRSLGWILGSLAALLLVAFGFVLAGLLGQSTNPTLAASSPPGRYHVVAACSDGACTVNECETPFRCGDRRVGVLHEGQHFEIECQLRGGRVGALNHQRSKIWDRLENEVFVTDLYASTKGNGRFSPGLPRCAPWGSSP